MILGRKIKLQIMAQMNKQKFLLFNRNNYGLKSIKKEGYGCINGL